VVDAKHKLIVADDVVQDRNDFNPLHPMPGRAKAAPGVERLEGLGDKGCCNMARLAQCEADGIAAYMPEPERGGRQRQGGRFTQEEVRYLPGEDAYLCPAGKRLVRSGQPRLQNGSTIKGYSGSETDCRRCPLRDRCITAKTTHREIWRNEHHALREARRRRLEANPGVMRERGALVEHPFGTLKCRAGWNPFLVRGLAKVRGEWSLMALAYHFTRALNILGLQAFKGCCAQKAACRC